MSSRSITHATFRIERTYDAPLARVYRAYADPAIKRRWFAEGEGWDIESYDLDFRIGKRISASLATTEMKPDGQGTKLVFTEQGAFLDGHDGVAQREEGTRELLEALAKELARSD